MAHGHRPTQDLMTKHTRRDDHLLARATHDPRPVAPEEIDAEHAAGAIVVDTRTQRTRWRDGDFPGAVVIDRDDLEWRLDPQSARRIAGVRYAARIIVLCQQGLVSPIDAATLRQLGVFRATHVAGGFNAWATAVRREDARREAYA